MVRVLLGHELVHATTVGFHLGLGSEVVDLGFDDLLRLLLLILSSHWGWLLVLGVWPCTGSTGIEPCVKATRVFGCCLGHGGIGVAGVFIIRVKCIENHIDIFPQLFTAT